MIKKLCKHGDGLALVIDGTILKQLQIEENTALEVSTDGQSLFVIPMREEQRRMTFEEALAWTNATYGKALKRLAE
jgi:antitoxin component of MazEF toxin-antitoxin module